MISETPLTNSDEQWNHEMATEKLSAEFSPGQIVVLKSDPSVKGAVVETVPGEPENRFKVFVAGSVRTYYASQLQAEDHSADDTQLLPCEEFHAYLTATPIQLDRHDLFVLLNTLRPDLILDQEGFKHMAEPNPFINQAVDHTRTQ